MKKYLLIIALISPFIIQAQVPQTLSYQGLLTDASGNPLSGTHTVLFNFYTTATGGSSSFARGPLTVTTFQGLFTAIIGNGQGSNNGGIPTLGSTQYYLGIVADGGAELSPRVTLTAVPYAFTASSLDPNAVVNGGQVGTGINASNITVGTLPAAQIASGSVDNTKLATGIDASKITVGSLGIGRLPNTTSAILDLSTGPAGTSSVNLPSNSTASRPAAPIAGALRYNTTENMLEYFNSSAGFWYFATPKIAFLKDIKAPAGTDGGTFTAGAWQTRNLNTVEGDPSAVALNTTTGEFTLTAGEYLIEAFVPDFIVNRSKARLFNVTSSTGLAESSSSWDPTNGATIFVIVFSKVNPTASATYRIENYGSTTRTGDGFGPHVGFGSYEVYTQVKITKLRGQ